MKDRTTAALLAIFLGGIGVHKFYLEKFGQGIIYLLLCWTWIPAIIGLIEGIVYFAMSEQEFQNKYSKNIPQSPQQSQYSPSHFSSNSASTPPPVQPNALNNPTIPQSPSYTPLTIPVETPSTSNMIASKPEDMIYEEMPNEQNANLSSLSTEELEYLEELKSYALDGIISDKERRLLEKLRELSGISKERAEFIEKNLL